MIVRGSVIPSLYREIEYIQSTGTQWINTGVKQRYASGKVYIKTETCQVNDTTTATFNFGNAYTQCGFRANGIYQTKKLVEVTWDSSTKKEIILVDGVQKVNTSWNASTWDNANIYLCNLGNTNGPYYNSTAHFKFWSCKIYYDDELVRDMIPCERISDSAVGMYDIVNNTFYGNVGTGVFTKGPYNNSANSYRINYFKNGTTIEVKNYILKDNSVPIEYQRVEYIANSNGNQYLHIPFIPNAAKGFKFEFDMTPTATGKRYCLLANYNVGNAQVSLELNASNKARFWANSGGLDKATSNSFSTSDVNKLIYEFKNNTWTINLNNTITTGSYTWSSASSSEYMRMFLDRAGRTSTFPTPIKIYSCIIYEEDKKKFELVPCYRKSDNVIGMYDTINHQFYYNQGSGSFTKGNDIPIEFI